jgi:BlaI family penicillinase repressor
MEGEIMDPTPKISDAEWLVMRQLWERAPQTTNEVVENLASQTTWKPKTIMTLLNRLVKKGALGFEKKGRIYEHFPLVREEDCVRAESRSFLERVYGGSLQPMLAHFLEETPLSKEEIEALRRILDERGK